MTIGPEPTIRTLEMSSRRGKGYAGAFCETLSTNSSKR
jgi:hypothetical protein